MISTYRIQSLAKFVCLALFLLGSAANAQDPAAIRGKITDAHTGMALAGVEVYLEGAGLGAGSADDGGYEILRIPPGKYTLVAAFLGYETGKQEIVLEAGERREVHFRLSPKPIDLGEILVKGDRAYSAASSESIREFDLKTRPTRSSQDLLQMVPGLIIAQHAGGGKAEQIYLRNFDADHGTDVAVSVDGMPVNMVSHGHGQGYADLHFLIADAVEGIEVHKGPYFANYGDLATAGAVSFRTKDHLEENFLRLEGGEFNSARLTALFQIPGKSDHQNAYLAGQFYQTDGPFESPQGFKRYNLFGKFHTHLSASARLSLAVDAFSSAWDASGQIPQRAVNDGTISRFGAIDDLEGGTTARQNLNLSYTLQGEGSSEFFIQAFASRYNFKLFSNFTFFLEDSANGDMIEQVDERQILGLNGRYRFRDQIGSIFAATTLGGGYRADFIDIALWRSPNRVRLENRVDSRVRQNNLFLWLQEDLLFSSLFRVQLGLRGDYFTFDVEDRLETLPDIEASGLPHASGYSQQALLSPKISLVFSPAPALDIYANAGSGFHSNDARNVVIGQRIADLEKLGRRQGMTAEQIEEMLRSRNFDPAQKGVETLPQALGGEVGFRARLAERVNFAAAAWYLYLEREYVYVGDAGTTELSDPTRRYGLDLELRFKLLPWLWGDADLNVSEGKIVDAPAGEDYIPLAPNLTSTGGLTALHPAGFEGSLRYRHVGERPANENNSVVALGSTVFDLSLGYRFGQIKLFGVLENVFDVEWNEAQFATESRLKGEPEPVSELHFTPGNPRNARLGISYAF